MGKYRLINYMFYKQTNESWFIVSDDLACLHYIQSST